jgi:hypothetical protein
VINTKRYEKKQIKRCRVSGSAILGSGSPYKSQLTDEKRNQVQPKKIRRTTKGDKTTDRTPCMYCSGLFCDDISGELWVRRRKCEQWAHGEGAGKDDEFESEIFCVRSKANRLRFDKIFASDFALLNYKKGHSMVNMSMMNG